MKTILFRMPYHTTITKGIYNPKNQMMIKYSTCTKAGRALDQ